jgi:hypothetical protein
MARSTKSDADKNPEKYEIDGLLGETNDTFQWDGNSGGSNSGCSSCDTPHEVRVEDVDRNDSSASYYIGSDKRNQCCGNMWVTASDLKRDGSSLPVLAMLAKDLRDKVASGTITLGELAKRTDEIYKTMAKDHYASGKKPFKGICSACYTDVVLVGGVVEHEDKRICSTPAILLS